MKSVRELRMYLGISQQDFADYLRISRPYLVKVERKTAFLSKSALLKLAQLEKYLSIVLDERSEDIKDTSNNEILLAYCEKLQRECSFKLAANKRNLSKMMAEYEKIKRLARILKLIKQEADGKDHLWLAMQEFKLSKKLLKYGEEQQGRIQARIALLHAESDSLEQYSKRFSSATKNVLSF